MKRCSWVKDGDLLMERYHDREWGVPVHRDNKIFEFLTLESFQAGLSWRTILNKRRHFQKAFADFNPVKVARFTDRDLRRLMSNKGIVRNKAKIAAAINNAARFLAVKKEFGAFAKYMWSFVNNQPLKNTIRKMSDYRPVSREAVAWAQDLKKRGFKFLGPTTVYAHMQAVGMVNDHMVGCFRRVGN